MSREGPWSLHVSICARADGNSTFTNMPAADTFLFNSSRHVVAVDVYGFSQVRLKVNKQGTAGNSGAKLILRYSPTFSTSVSNYIDIGTSEVSVAVDTTNTYIDSGWITLNDDVGVGDDDIFLAVVGNGGNGVLDPIFGSIGVSFR